MKLKKLIGIITIIVMLSFILASLTFSAQAATTGNIDVSVDVKYGQTEARKMLNLINEFRTNTNYSEDGGAWYWEADNTTKHECSGLTTLTYDYNLEKIAMQRATEIALNFSHTRPNGTSCFTAYTGNYSAKGENIAAGYGTAKDTFIQWREDKENHDGQGHRINMLSSNFNAVGIGHVVYNGMHFWVQEFGNSNSGLALTTANDSTANVNVEVKSDILNNTKKLLSYSDLSIEIEKEAELPTITSTLTFNEGWPTKNKTITLNSNWSIADSSIVKIENNKIKAIGIGTTTITSDVDSNLKVTITVTKKSLQGATVVLAGDKFDYDGYEKVPSVTSVTLNGKALTRNDYDISYKNNTNPGTATVIITGKGMYTGTVNKEFQIICNHVDTELRNQKQASYAEEGYTGDKYCKNCNSILEKGKAIEKLVKTENKTPEKESSDNKLDKEDNKTQEKVNSVNKPVDESVNKAEKSVTPKTGDNIIVYISILTVSMLGASTIILSKIKLNKQKGKK